MKEENHYIFPSRLRAEQMPGCPRSAFGKRKPLIWAAQLQVLMQAISIERSSPNSVGLRGQPCLTPL